jgi:hypothetical protein
VLLRDHGLITLNDRNRVTAWKASLITDGGSAYIYVNDRNDDATRRELTEIFNPLAGAQGSGISRVIGHDEIVAMGGDPEAFLALEAVEGTVITGEYTGKVTEPSKLGGTHGYFPDRPEMRASLIYYGPSIAAGKITNARMIDIGPTIAALLHVDIPNPQGVPLAVGTSAVTSH